MINKIKIMNHDNDILNNSDINKKILLLLQEKFNLRMKIFSGQLNKIHFLKIIRKDIARLKMLLNKDKGS